MLASREAKMKHDKPLLLTKLYTELFIRFGFSSCLLFCNIGWSGGAMVLGNLPAQGCPTVWMIVGQGPTALAVGVGGGCLDIFTLIYLHSSFSLSLGDSPILYCLKGH